MTHEKLKFQWYKYRECWSSGYGPWQYEYLLNIYKDEFFEEHAGSWSEHWRGYDIEEIEYPPQDYYREFLRDERDIIKTRILQYREHLEVYNKVYGKEKV